MNTYTKDDLEYGENRIDGFKVTIIEDSDPESPREWDNVGTMVCWHRNYILGDEQPSESSERFIIGLVEQYIDDTDLDYDEDDDEYRALALEMLTKHYVVLPLFLYDHSGITMNTSGFACPWDSGQVGFIYASKQKLKDEGIEDGEAALRGEVETYDQYLRGAVYGYTIEDEDDEVVDSCWGFYGEDYVKEQAIEALNYAIEEKHKDHMEDVKTWIRHKVPLHIRQELLQA